MMDETNEGHGVEVADLKTMWGLGRVVRNCRGFLGEYKDVETGKWCFVFLGDTREDAIGRMNHMRSFLN